MSLSQVQVILWKNYLLAKNKLKKCICEIITLLLFLGVLVLFGLTPGIPNKTYNEFCSAKFEGSKCTKGSNENLLMDSEKQFLVYSPHNSVIDTVMEAVGKTLKKNVSGFGNSKDLVAYFLTENKEKTLAGVEFDDNLADKDELPSELTIKLRFPSEMQSMRATGRDAVLLWHTDKKESDDIIRTTQGSDVNEDFMPFYYREGFLGLQQLVTYFLILVQQNKTSENSISDYNSMPKITMEKFPQVKFRTAIFTETITLLISGLIITVISTGCSATIQLMMTEKQANIQEILKISNVRVATNFIAWVIYGMLRTSVCGLGVVVVLRYNWFNNGPLCEYSNIAYLVLIILLIQLVMVVWALVLTTFSSSAIKVTLIDASSFILQLIVFYALYKEKRIAVIIAASMMPYVCSCFLIQCVIALETKAMGAQWEYTWHVCNESRYTLGLGITVTLIEVVLLILLYFYLDTVMPKEFGSYRPWNFLCMKSTCSGGEEPPDADDPTTSEETTSSTIPKFVEDDPRNLKAGVEIKQLRKNFKENVAVKGISFKMFENQVTVLLGPNGAGKTTLISMVVGLLKPTSGTAIVNGYNIETQLRKARKSIGICPQFNPLYDGMTVEQHLKLYCQLRGSENTSNEIEHYLRVMRLVDKRHELSESLSGGLKRRLSVALAFCGGAKLVFLDEPTSGVDATNRRDIWDLIISGKEGRTILLTTHMMDEADFLADRIVIIADGEMRCAGTSFFLKKHYGTGYQLVIEKAPDCNPAAITSLLKDYIKGIKIQTNVGTKLTYVLPEEYLDVFPDMLSTIENNVGSLKIKSYGIQLATLEEVFLRAGTGEGYKKEKAAPKPTGQSEKSKNLLTGPALIRQQILAMLMKRCVVSSIIATLCVIILPMLWVLVLALTVTKPNSLDDLPAWKFSLSHYKDATVILERNTSYESFNASFRNAIFVNGGNIKEVSDVRSFIRKESEHSPSHDFKYLFGANFHTESDNSTKIKLWFNNYYLHTPGLGMQLVLDAIYKQEMGTDHKIQFVNHPLKLDPETKKVLITPNMWVCECAYVISLVYCALCIFHVKDIDSNSKHLQLSLGTNIFVYWLTAHIVDLIICLLSVTLIVIVIACFKVAGFRTLNDLALLFFILMLFCSAFLSTIYYVSLVTKVTADTFLSMFSSVVFQAVLSSILSQVLSENETADKVEIALIFLLEVYALEKALFRMQAHDNIANMCNEFISECVKNGVSETLCREYTCNSLEICCSLDNIFALTKHGLGYCVLGWVFSVIVQALFVVVLERGYSITCNPKKDTTITIDEDVIEEKFKIKNTPKEELIKNNAVVLESVSKAYCKMMAVQDISLAIRANECFGLLGTNGAGKTTLFKILTGDIKMFKGEGWTHGWSLRKQIGKVRRHISYCPQFDALLEDMTVRQTLKMYCLIRGVRLQECNGVLVNLAKEFDFEKHMDKKIKQLSGGTKRKVSSAVAMIGDPDTIYLDEPTTGMDVATRRHLWNQIITAYGNGKCVVLTTHSMEESEALCTRVAIMVNGQIICLGSIQHLKNKYVKGCSITVKIKKDADMRQVDSFMKDNFPNCKFVEQHQDLLKFTLEGKMQWSQMFKIMQRAKKDNVFEDYTIVQPSLEDVFLTLTKYQRS